MQTFTRGEKKVGLDKMDFDDNRYAVVKQYADQIDQLFHIQATHPDRDTRERAKHAIARVYIACGWYKSAVPKQ